MTEMEFVTEALAPFLACAQRDDQLAVPTHCLYPSNTSVTVYVTGGPHGARVSDDGGAIDELSHHGCLLSDPDKYLRRFCRRAGLNSQHGRIYSSVVPADGLVAAVALVANTSSTAAHWGIDRITTRRLRDLRKELYAVLKQRFPEERILLEGRLTGKSNRQYHFDHVITLNRDRRLVVDSVLPDANSINSRAIAHLDLAQKEDPNITQRMVYDEDQEWASADLNLLQMASTLVPLSRLAANLERLTIH